MYAHCDLIHLETEGLNNGWGHRMKVTVFLKVDRINFYIFDRINRFVNEIQLTIHKSLRPCEKRI